MMLIFMALLGALVCGYKWGYFAGFNEAVRRWTVAGQTREIQDK